MPYHKKLIEVALPLDAINAASAREKSIRHGHPSTLHLWWARRPLAAARAVIFAQMVDDPSEYVDELLADPSTRQAAEREYRRRLQAWEGRKLVYEKALAAGMNGAANPEPGQQPALEAVAADLERQRLFRLIEDLVLWENTTNEAVLQPAREEIWRSWRRTCKENANDPRAKELFDPDKLPAFHDPFAGGGALPLEAQRLGLESYASDLNPVAVLINKAMIEIPPKFAGCPPVNPEVRQAKDFWSKEWKGAQGLAEDVRYYGQWLRDEAEKRIGYLYPKVPVTTEMSIERPDLKPYVGKSLTVIAWLWARTVKSPNPAFSHVDIPLVSSFMLSTKNGKEAYVKPVIEGDKYHFEVRAGKPKDAKSVSLGTTAGKRNAFRCLMSDVPVTYDHIRSEGKSGRMCSRLLAVVVMSEKGRIYLSPTKEMEYTAERAKPEWAPENELPNNPRDFKTPNYGMSTFAELFTPRQLVALDTCTDLVQEALEVVKSDAIVAGLQDDNKHLVDGGNGATAYAEAVVVYLAFSIDKAADYWSTVCSWHSSKELIRNTFGRQAIPMTWDYAETNVFSNSTGNISSGIEWAHKVLLALPQTVKGAAVQADAQLQSVSFDRVVSTDPPYYDNICYADLSDFFYVWLRRSLRPIFPELFSTMAAPKAEELVASPYRHGGKEKAEDFFLHGMTKVMGRLKEQANPAFPVTIYYAFKQAENDAEEGVTSTGWDTFLDAIIQSGFAITGTWPIRTELSNRMIGSGNNALASSIIIVCRKQATNAQPTTRREFINRLKSELPSALGHMQASNIAPVDLAQGAIGPGMEIFTRYSKVLDAQGKPLTVHQALALINEIIDEVFTEQEGEFDADTRWALAWFEQNGFYDGEYGVAETLSKAKNTSVAGMVEAGILRSAHGKVRLYQPSELNEDWNPNTDRRLTAWEMVHQLVRKLEDGGEGAAAELAARLGSHAETARELCYRLYTVCERKKRAAEALSYNALVQSWPEITRLARASAQPGETQAPLL